MWNRTLVAHQGPCWSRFFWAVYVLRFHLLFISHEFNVRWPISVGTLLLPVFRSLHSRFIQVNISCVVIMRRGLLRHIPVHGISGSWYLRVKHVKRSKIYLFSLSKWRESLVNRDRAECNSSSLNYEKVAYVQLEITHRDLFWYGMQFVFFLVQSLHASRCVYFHLSSLATSCILFVFHALLFSSLVVSFLKRWLVTWRARL